MKAKCDYEGKCKNKVYAEVYPDLGKHNKKDKGWSYLCKKHLIQECKSYKKKGEVLPYCLVK